MVFTELALTLLIGCAAGGIVYCLANCAPGSSRGSHVPMGPDVARAGCRGRMSRGTANRICAAMLAAYVLAMGGMAVLRHVSLHSGGFDLGIFDQIVWNSLRGRLFENSISIDAPISLGQHFSPILLSLVPLYAVWADPIVLLVVQTLALAFAGWPLYWFARERLGDGMAVLMTGAYVLFPALQFVNLWDVHEIALATPLLALTLYFLSHRRMFPFLVCLFLVFLVKEELSIAIVGFGLFLIVAQRRFALGLSVAALGVLSGAAILLWLIPSFGNATYGSTYQYVDRYSYLGQTVGQIVVNALVQPSLVIQHLLVPPKIEFVLQLLTPLAFTPLLGGQVLALAVPEFAYLLLADHPFQNSIRFQYTAPLIPIVFFSAVIGIERLTHCRSKQNQAARTKAMAALIAVVTVVNYYFQAPGPFGQQMQAADYGITSHTAIGYSLMSRIPPNASVLAEAGLVPHLSQRGVAFEASLEYPPDLRRVDYVFADTTLPVHTQFPQIWGDILDSPYFSPVAEQDGYLIKRRLPLSAGHPLQIGFAKRIHLLGYTVESGEPPHAGQNANLILIWRADQTIHRRFVCFLHLVDPHGNIRAQDDHEPGNGWLRTDRWNSGDVTPDRYTLALGRDLPAGSYALTAGLYTVDGQTNLPAEDPSGRELGDAPVIGTVNVLQ